MPDQKLSFAKAYAELQEITKEFESGDLDLETSIPKFKRSAVLVKFLKTELKKMENQIEEINLEFEQDEPKSPSPEPSNQEDIPF